MPRKMSAGWTLTKYFKFGHIPIVLRSYEYVLHVDSSAFTARNHNNYIVPKLLQLSKFLLRHRDAELIFWKHPARTYAIEEWVRTTHRFRLERIPNIRGFARAMTYRFGCTAVSTVPLFEMGLFVRKVCVHCKSYLAFIDTFRALLAYGLRRDQNVVPLAVLGRHDTTFRDSVFCCPKDSRLPVPEQGQMMNCIVPPIPLAKESNASLDDPAFFKAAEASLDCCPVPIKIKGRIVNGTGYCGSHIVLP